MLAFEDPTFTEAPITYWDVVGDVGFDPTTVPERTHETFMAEHEAEWAHKESAEARHSPAETWQDLEDIANAMGTTMKTVLEDPGNG